MDLDAKVYPPCSTWVADSHPLTLLVTRWIAYSDQIGAVVGAERAWQVVAVGGGASAFDALADDTRRTVLSLLREHGELTVSDLAARIEHIGRTAVSMQLKVLREAGMVQERKAGKFRYYSLRVEPIHDVVAFLSTLYGASLDQLATLTEQHRDPEAEQRRWGTSY